MQTYHYYSKNITSSSINDKSHETDLIMMGLVMIMMSSEVCTVSTLVYALWRSMMVYSSLRKAMMTGNVSDLRRESPEALQPITTIFSHLSDSRRGRDPRWTSFH